MKRSSAARIGAWAAGIAASMLLVVGSASGSSAAAVGSGSLRCTPPPTTGPVASVQAGSFSANCGVETLGIRWQ